MNKVTFRMTDNKDPEERLEEAALWKALHDEYGDDISLTDDRPTFGRGKRNDAGNYLQYWTDPAFLSRANREFRLCALRDAESAVADLHSRGKGALIKSTQEKYFIERFPVGSDFHEVMGAMAFSFCDRGPCLMVQEFVDMRYEHRFFCVDRKIVTDSPIAWHLTPLDYPLGMNACYRTPAARHVEFMPDVVDGLRTLAEEAAAELASPTCSIDCAWIAGKPGIVELNPLALGQIGLYACSVRALAKASRKMLPVCAEDAA